MIIYGTKGIGTAVKQGHFYCDNCRTEREYVLKEYKKFFTLFFIPLFPIHKIGDQLECKTCRTAYVPGSILPSGEYTAGTSLSSSSVSLGGATSFPKRLGAYVIDMVLVYLLTTLAISVSVSMNSPFSLNIFTVALIGMIYGTSVELLTKGSTLGKLILSMKVVDLEEKHITIDKLLIRNLVKYITGIFALIYLVAAFREDKRALHDLAAGTIVIDKS